MATSDFIAFGALLVSIYTIISSELKSKKNDREQRVIKDEQDRLRKIILEKETKSAINELKAELGARLMKISNGNYRLKIYNKGKVEARNIEISFPDNDENEYLSASDIEQKFPYEILHPQNFIELIAWQSLNSKRKYKIKIKWDDDYQKDNEIDILVST